MYRRSFPPFSDAPNGIPVGSRIGFFSRISVLRASPTHKRPLFAVPSPCGSLICRTRSAEVLPQFANFSRVTFGFTPLKFRKKGLRRRTALSLYYSEFNMSNDFQLKFFIVCICTVIASEPPTPPSLAERTQCANATSRRRVLRASNASVAIPYMEHVKLLLLSHAGDRHGHKCPRNDGYTVTHPVIASEQRERGNPML